VSWSSSNLLAVGLRSSVYIWTAATSDVSRLCDFGEGALPHDTIDEVTGLEWTNRVSVDKSVAPRTVLTTPFPSFRSSGKYCSHWDPIRQSRNLGRRGESPNTNDERSYGPSRGSGMERPYFIYGFKGSNDPSPRHPCKGALCRATQIPSTGSLWT
jgi:hypothetical protein